jgi:DNA-binding MarR family transcriptional regulator
MVVLANQPASAAQDVAAMTGLHPMNISARLRGCARPAGSRRPGAPDNHRRTLLWLTKAGETTFRDIAPHSERQAARLLDALSASELASAH